ncbi:MAG: PKD domain-containing protein [Crocinitomicaceae bacterium]|nr:PKD domain-containing protein [Crocinitomicaceae bacterium]|tara:strand:+ start:10789 stop:12855 length:2067 start_codon:yes stop_codon:yes gene_type:complete
MKNLILRILVCFYVITGYSQVDESDNPCIFDHTTNNRKHVELSELKIQAAIKQAEWKSHAESSDIIRTIPVVVHVIHNGGSENISEAQIQSQIQILNEDYGKISGTNGDGNGVDTRIRFCLAKIDPKGRCTNGIVRVKSSLTNHQSYQRAMLKELSFWDNEKYLNIYTVKSINGNVGGYSSFPDGPAEEDGFVVRHNLFGNLGSASSSIGRTASHELGHWLGLYHTFNNGCGIDLCTDGDYVCDTPPQSLPSYNCDTLNTCSNDFPDLNDQKENYMNYTPDTCKNMFTNGQRLRIKATLDTIRKQIWQYSNLVSTGCDSNYITPTICPVTADFVTLSRNICIGNSVYFMDKSLNQPNAWQWTFAGGTPASSNNQNPTVTYSTPGIYSVKLVVSDSNSMDSTEVQGYITVKLPGVGDALSYKEDFDSGIYPPLFLTVVNNDGGVTWEIDSLASVSGNYSIKINNLINTNYGSTDELVLPNFNLSTAHPDSNIFMSFKWAYAKSDSTFSDELLVLLSTDCGVNYNRVFNRRQNALATGPTQSTPFIPDSTQWKKAFIPLNNYRSETYMELKIVNLTDGGNNLYIDDIYVGDGSLATTSTSDVSLSLYDINLYPNPSYGNITLEYTFQQAHDLKIDIYDLKGKLILEFNEGVKQAGNHQIFLTTNNIEQGMYLVKIRTEREEKFVRLMIMD